MSDPAGQEPSDVLPNLGKHGLASRYAVVACVSASFSVFVGWPVAAAWFAISVVLHSGLRPILTWVNCLPVPTPARRGLSLSLLLLCHGFWGSVAAAAALMGGPWGTVAGVLYLATCVIFAIKDRSHQLAFDAAFATYSGLLAMMPLIALWLQVPPAAVATISVGILFFIASFFAINRAQERIMQEMAQARRTAEAATAAKSAFVAMVSHELRTPISGILAGAAEQERLASDRAGRTNAALIGDSARMMRSLLNDLLDLSKIEAGRMTVEHIDFDLRRLVLDTTRFWAPEADKQHLRLRLRGAHHLPQWVEGDPTRIRQIINNLMSNALKFTEAGTVTLQFRPVAAGGADFELHLEVIDTGPGMDAGQVKRLFQAFDQLGASTARTHGGTGLGLNISHQLAGLMGGDLTAQSTPGVGTSFRLVVPMIRLVAPRTPALGEGDVEVARGLRVLIADDHQVNRQAFSLILDPFCDQVTTVENGEQALEALHAAVFDVVLMDLNMPVLGGLEAVRRLRAEDGPNRRTVVIALTASGEVKDFDACLAAGMDTVVVKPVEAGELLAAIDQALSASQPQPMDRAGAAA